MKIRYPKSLPDIPAERQEELEEEIAHFLRFSPCQRLCYVEREWSALQDYLGKSGIKWSRNSS